MKINNKDILFASNVLTQNQSEIQKVIKNQLQKENQISNDFSKIFTNSSSLNSDSVVQVVINIKVNSKNPNLAIYIEKVNLLNNSRINDKNNRTIFQNSFRNF